VLVGEHGARAVLGPNTGSGRYSLGADTERVDVVRYWCQAGLVTALPLGLA
jgi:hypothetical protein